MGLHEAVALCVDHCHAAELTCDDSWFKTVVLSGGSACLPGLAGSNGPTLLATCLIFHHRLRTFKSVSELTLLHVIQLFWFRKVAEGPVWASSFIHIQWSQSHSSTIWCRHSLVWSEAY